MLRSQLFDLGVVLKHELRPDPVHHVISVLLVDSFSPSGRNEHALKQINSCKHSLKNKKINVSPDGCLLLLLVQLLDHLPHLGAKLQVRRFQLLLILFQFLIIFFQQLQFPDMANL